MADDRAPATDPAAGHPAPATPASVSTAFVPLAFAEATVPAAFAEAAVPRPPSVEPSSGTPAPAAGTAGESRDHQPRGPRIDRRRDLPAYLSVPLVTLFAGPALTVFWSLVVLGGSGTAPSVCEPVRTSNGCEELTWELMRQHVLAFLALWLLLWALPWWRGLRKHRILLAVAIIAVLLALPVRMAS